MFPKVPQAENAYLALYYHPGAIHKKWWRRNFAKLNNFSGIAMADRGSDRSDPQVWLSCHFIVGEIRPSQYFQGFILMI